MGKIQRVQAYVFAKIGSWSSLVNLLVKSFDILFADRKVIKESIWPKFKVIAFRGGSSLKSD